MVHWFIGIPSMFSLHQCWLRPTADLMNTTGHGLSWLHRSTALSAVLFCTHPCLQSIHTITLFQNRHCLWLDWIGLDEIWPVLVYRSYRCFLGDRIPRWPNQPGIRSHMYPIKNRIHSTTDLPVIVTLCISFRSSILLVNWWVGLDYSWGHTCTEDVQWLVGCYHISRFPGWNILCGPLL